ncbi:PD-(D/E)XK nuclease family protein [Acetobacterium sp.]|uniref:PDDEXK-like family protein n=1 Tax=Acetobacterium sp. TaxID=1872094 RepID=UPI0035937426
MNIEEMLKNITAVSEKYDLINQKTGGWFNIFRIMDVSTNEVKICQLICDLLNPYGSHYQGTSYLKLFVEHVLKIDNFNYNGVRVFREYLTSENRRIDLVIENSTITIPIEVKIYADDQVNQLKDYFEMARGANVFYLSLFEREPDKKSIGNMNTDRITNITFEKDIVNWIDRCLQLRETITIAPIREVLLQFRMIIKTLANQMGDEKEVEVKELISKNSESIKSAVAIEQSLKQCKIDMMYKLFSTLENKLELHGLKKIDVYDYSNGKVEKYYNIKGTTYPALSYLYKKGVKPYVDIILRFEIEYDFFIGFCTPINNTCDGVQLTMDEIRKNLVNIDSNRLKIDYWWIYIEELLLENESPNFNAHNEAYYKLFDENHFNAFIENCVERALELLK